MRVNLYTWVMSIKFQDGCMWKVYLVKCADSSLYCGITTDLERRVKQHNGELVGGARYTRSRRPVTVVYQESHDSRSSATSRERQLKRLPVKAKQALYRNTSKVRS
ncbi:MAG: GIY-YIG nuclease family protein [Pseudomonadota bacterium]